MSETVKLLFGVHAHQPAGNFPEVVRDAHMKCYKPFLEVLERHPQFPFAIHISGWLMEFLWREFPEDMTRLLTMVDRGQAEIFGGGDTEPVLAAIPDADRHSQIAALSDRIQRRFHVRPRGAWLTERVWEATVVPALADERIDYVAVDDYHFLCAGQSPDRMDGHFSTEQDWRRLDLFPISEALRYKFPFAPVADAIAHVEGARPGGAAIYFDDIEKFGIWPETHDWVYGRRWLEDFVEGVERSRLIEPMRYADYHAAHRSRGVVYLPTVSYYEMSEWTLPPKTAERFAHLVSRAKHEGTFEQDKVFLRGGQWRNFFSRYPESNWMHKRMQMASSRYASLADPDRTPQMQADLHLAQSNDAYWHGLFGGIYLPHLRRQVYAAIARLEAAIDARTHHPALAHIDLDYDGEDEIFLWCPQALAVVKTDAGASLRELTHYGLAHNFCDTLQRREESYYEKIRSGARPGDGERGGVASIHDRLAYRMHICAEDLTPDRHPRTAFLDFWRPKAGEEVRIDYAALPTRGRSSAKFSGGFPELEVGKRVTLGSLGPTVSYHLAAREPVDGVLAIEFNIAMPSCDGPGGAYVAGGSKLGGFGDSIRMENCASLRLVDGELGGSLHLSPDAPGEVVASPLYTVSQSEAGFEKIWQAATIRWSWPIKMAPRERMRRVVRLRIRAGTQGARPVKRQPEKA